MNIRIDVCYTLMLGITIAVNELEKKMPCTYIVFLHLIRKYVTVG